jgi:hypothetical protein
MVWKAEEATMTEQLTIHGRVVYVRRDRYGIAAVGDSIEALESVLGTAQPTTSSNRPGVVTPAK